MYDEIASEFVPQKHIEVVPLDSFDRDMLSGLLGEVPSLGELSEKASETVMNGDSLVQDINACFWKAEPRVRRTEELAVSSTLNRVAVEAVLNHPDTEDLRKHTVYDRYATALATDGVGEAAMKAVYAYQERLRQIEEEIEQREQERKEQEERERQENPDGEPSDDGDGQKDGDGADGPGSGPGGRGRPGGPIPQDLQDKIQKLIDEATPNVGHAIKGHITQQLKDLDDEAEMFGAWGIDGSELQKMDFTERKALADRLCRSRIAKFRAMIGRFRMTAKANIAQKVEFGRDELYNLTLGNDPSEIVPSEFAALAHPLLKKQFMRKFAEGQLLINKWRGKQKAADGPIITAIDTSGSMTGEREAWAKAFAMALMEVAKKDKRAYSTIVFADRSHQKRIDGTDLPAMIDVGETFYSGGTNFDVPVKMVIDAVQHEEEHKKSDFVIITDGECDMRPETWALLADARAKGLRVFGIAVGYQPGAVLERMCDNVRAITDFNDPNTVSDIYTML